MNRIRQSSVRILGCGAIGSRVAMDLARAGVAEFHIQDKDRVESHNIGTQIWDGRDVGRHKTDCLRLRLHQTVGSKVLVEHSQKDITLARSTGPRTCIVVDCFDNKAARERARELYGGVNLLHVGMGTGLCEVRWDDDYKIPEDRNDGNECEYPMSSSLACVTAGLATETIIRFIVDDIRMNVWFTIGDMKIGMEMLDQ